MNVMQQNERIQVKHKRETNIVIYSSSVLMPQSTGQVIGATSPLSKGRIQWSWLYLHDFY